jgi:hypothetical protein
VARERLALAPIDETLVDRLSDRVAQVHHRDAELAITVLGRGVRDRHLVVVLVRPIGEPLEDPSDSAHAECRQLGRPERPHARGAEHVNAALERYEDLLVPNRGHRPEEAVDDPDRARAVLEEPQDVAL